MRFKTGDRVKVVSSTDNMDEYVGRVGTVTVSGDPAFPYRVALDDIDYWVPDGRLFFDEELEPEVSLVAEDKPKGYVWRDYAGTLHLQAYLSSVPDDATVVWELGDELVKTVKWEKKDA